MSDYGGWLFSEDLLLAVALAVAATFVAVRAIAERRTLTLSKPMGPVQWDAKDSWATTITVIGGVVTAFLAGVAFPDYAKNPLPPLPAHFFKGQYQALSLLFAFLILLAAFLYNAARRPKKVTDVTSATPAQPNAPAAAAATEPQLQGFVWSFLVASVLTLWAVVGQLFTTFALIDELRQFGVVVARPDSTANTPSVVYFPAISGAFGIVFWVLLAIAVAGLGVYAWFAMGSALDQATDVAKAKRTLQAKMSAMGLVPLAAADIEPPLPTWKLL